MPQDTSADIAARAAAFLFTEGDSITLKKLAQYVGTDEATLSAALDELKQRLTGTGLTLVRTETEAALAVAPEVRDTVAAVMQREQDRDIGDAGLEVLGVVLYEGPSTRATIDYIRGVNSTSTIRALLSRGLLERTGNPVDGREYLYRPSIQLLAHLGVTSTSELPDMATIAEELKSFKEKGQQEVLSADGAAQNS